MTTIVVKTQEELEVKVAESIRDGTVVTIELAYEEEEGDE